MEPDRDAMARRVLTLVDLTSLEESDDDAKIETLCSRAVTPFGAVAAVCVFGRFIRVARRALAGTGIRVATVANFPDGQADIRAAADEVRTLVAAGADEVDVVFPYRAFLAGDRAIGGKLMEACRAACRPPVRLKAILETGRLERSELIAEASRDAIGAGADFVKTSTGKLQPGATPEAARAMLSTIRDVRDAGGPQAGFKAAGGVRTLEQARVYIDLAEAILGPDWGTPTTLRIGASGLLDDLLRMLGGTGNPAAASTG